MTPMPVPVDPSDSDPRADGGTGQLPPIEWGQDPAIESCNRVFQKYNSAAVATTYGVLRDPVLAEPELTRIFQVAVPEGARLEGLQFRLKAPHSLARKVNGNLQLHRTNINMAADKIKDRIRYTLVPPSPEMFVDSIEGAVALLEEHGCVVESAKNHFASGAAYKGFHVWFWDSLGRIKIELQFHTAESLQAKMETHHQYEVSRDDEIPFHERYAAWNFCQERSAMVGNPPGIELLTIVGDVGVKGPDPAINPYLEQFGGG